MTYEEYLERLRRHAPLGDLAEYGRVMENNRFYPLMRLTTPGERVLTLTTGFHGEEQAGPLTMLEHLPEIAQLARSSGVGLRVYPCINPSGFEAQNRYNASGERPNNDLLRYEVEPGRLVGELTDGQQFLRWTLFTEGPKETRALRQDLQRFSPPHAALDIHQDKGLRGQLTYAYTFGDRDAYRPLLAASRRHAGIAASTVVDEITKVTTDQEGLVEFRDGSVTDYFSRLGVPYTAALETTVETPLSECHQVNLIWIRGFIALAGR